MAGALADRRDRIWVIRMTQVVSISQAVLLAALTYSGLMTIWPLFLLTLVLGSANAVAQPARLALIPSLVNRESLPSAGATHSLLLHPCPLVGPRRARLPL